MTEVKRTVRKVVKKYVDGKLVEQHETIEEIEGEPSTVELDHDELWKGVDNFFDGFNKWMDSFPRFRR
jgi:hypothetical protein